MTSTNDVVGLSVTQLMRSATSSPTCSSCLVSFSSSTKSNVKGYARRMTRRRTLWTLASAAAIAAGERVVVVMGVVVVGLDVVVPASLIC